MVDIQNNPEINVNRAMNILLGERQVESSSSRIDREQYRKNELSWLLGDQVAASLIDACNTREPLFGDFWGLLQRPLSDQELSRELTKLVQNAERSDLYTDFLIFKNLVEEAVSSPASVNAVSNRIVEKCHNRKPVFEPVL